jgi:subtilisin family serine protease
LVVPPRFASIEDDGFSGTFVAPIRLQEVYGAANFPPGLMLINTLSFRPNAGSGAATDAIALHARADIASLEVIARAAAGTP